MTKNYSEKIVHNQPKIETNQCICRESYQNINEKPTFTDTIKNIELTTFRYQILCAYSFFYCCRLVIRRNFATFFGTLMKWLK